MKNPLNKRFIRELKNDLGKYTVLFVFIVAMIAVVSGFRVASGSMSVAYNENFDKYNIEDGNFEIPEKADEELVEKIENEGVTLYENFYIDDKTDYGATMRIFINREKVNKVCLMSGKMPEKDNEIAIDRLHAEKNGLEIGDVFVVSGRELTISGLVSLTDYSALYELPTDSMFDTIKFGVAVMTEEGFNTLNTVKLHYSYSWKYDEKPVDDAEAKTMSENFMTNLIGVTPLKNYVPAYSNQAIRFAGDDMVRDSEFIMMFLYIIMVIVAFIFAITTSNTISAESAVIGTLRASGYTKGEMIRHYLAMPMLITLIGAVVGNILGYTFFEDYAATLYYNSYSLTTYNVLFNKNTFVMTTAAPLIIIFIINTFIITRKLNLSPLRFIRRDLGNKKKKKAFKLNTKIGIMKRFRLRIIFQNMPNYITIVIGVTFANILMIYGVALPSLFNNYSDRLTDNMLSKYQYMLRTPVETSCDTAEMFTAYTLKTQENRGFTEQVSMYGIIPDSKYIDAEFDKDEVYISSAYSEKYNVEVGDVIVLSEEYEDKDYKFKVSGIYDYSIGIAVFMNQETLNGIFGFEEKYYNGYFSDEEIDDIDSNMVATVIDEEVLNKMSRQLIDSMDGLIEIFFIIGVIIFVLIIYLLSKIIVEKNSQSISMIKILGYENKEINNLYVITTAVVVIASLIMTMPLVDVTMKKILEMVFLSYSGWFPYYVPVTDFIFVAVTGIVSYIVIAFFQMKKVRRIPMEDALKNIE